MFIQPSYDFAFHLVLFMISNNFVLILNTVQHSKVLKPNSRKEIFRKNEYLEFFIQIPEAYRRAQKQLGIYPQVCIVQVK